MRGSFWLFLVLFCCGTGCPQQQPVSVSAPAGEADEASQIHLTFPAKLLSECGRKEDGVRLPVSIPNLESTAQVLVFDGTGCSCYGVWQGDRRLELGDRIPVGPQEAAKLEIQGSSPGLPRVVNYRATFHWESHEKTESDPLQVTLTTEFKRDLELAEPLLVDAVQNQLGKPQQRDIAVVSYTRRPVTDETAIQLGTAPSWLTLSAVEYIARPREVEPGLWRQEWILKLKIVPPHDLTPDAIISPWEVKLIQDNAAVASVREQARVRLKTSLQFPRSVSLGRLQVGEEKTRRIQIQSLVQRPFSLTSHPENSDQLHVNLDTTEQTSHPLSVTVIPRQTGSLDEVLKLQTTDPEIPVVTIQFTGYVIDPPTAPK